MVDLQGRNVFVKPCTIRVYIKTIVLCWLPRGLSSMQRVFHINTVKKLR